MVSVLKRGGGHHKNGTGVMSTSFTVQSMPESDYVDDGKFSSDDDASRKSVLITYKILFIYLFHICF